LQPTRLLHKWAPSRLTLPTLPAIHKAAKSKQPVHIHCEGGNSIVCQNVGHLSTLGAAHPWKPKFYTELQLLKPNHIYSFV
jgi:hypothetical protein